MKQSLSVTKELLFFLISPCEQLNCLQVDKAWVKTENLVEILARNDDPRGQINELRAMKQTKFALMVSCFAIFVDRTEFIVFCYYHLVVIDELTANEE